MTEVDPGGIPYDIATSDNSRTYGDAWFDFLGASRTMLGYCSNAFDYDGYLEQQINEFAVREKSDAKL